MLYARLVHDIRVRVGKIDKFEREKETHFGVWQRERENSIIYKVGRDRKNGLWVMGCECMNACCRHNHFACMYIVICEAVLVCECL